jgi:hypothetical protein
MDVHGILIFKRIRFKQIKAGRRVCPHTASNAKAGLQDSIP